MKRISLPYPRHGWYIAGFSVHLLTTRDSLTLTLLAHPLLAVLLLQSHLELKSGTGLWGWSLLERKQSLNLHSSSRRRAAGSTQVSRPNSTRAAGAGGSSNTMLKLYTDDSPGLRVCVFYLPSSGVFLKPSDISRISETHLLFSSCHCLSLARSSSSISRPRSFAPSRSKETWNSPATCSGSNIRLSRALGDVALWNGSLNL